MLIILLAFLAGALTIAAPCILPLLPILLGTAVGQTSRTRPLFIVLGFTLIFTAAALGLSFLTSRLNLSPNALRQVAIIILALFGFFLLFPALWEVGLSHFNRLFNRANQAADKTSTDNWGGFLLGMTLGLVWTPCAGPVLGSALALIALQKDPLTGGILLVAYGLGAGLPMLLIAYGGQYISARIRWLSRYTVSLQRAFGLIIILLALAIYLNYDTKIYAWLLANYPALNPKL